MQGDTIYAPANATGQGAVGIMRISGPRAFEAASQIFRPAKAHNAFHLLGPQQLTLGQVFDAQELIDEVLLVKFQAPHSYTGEDVVEINYHGSPYILQALSGLFSKMGLRPAQPGEFTFRAYMNGKLDLSQAEAVGDVIAAQSKAAHLTAMQQLRGGYAQKLKVLRSALVKLAALLELELDFSGEDVEFANRSELDASIQNLITEMQQLAASFGRGNAFKNGVPVAIVGKPNTGKSTLLNALLNEERSIVSDIPGTTRDTIEDVINLHGITFRFIDTAGLRQHGTDTIEAMGIQRSYQKMKEARIVLYLIDGSQPTADEFQFIINEYSEYLQDASKDFILVLNKSDLAKGEIDLDKSLFPDFVALSAKLKTNLGALQDLLADKMQWQTLGDDVLMSSARHLDAVNETLAELTQAQSGLSSGLPTDLVAEHVRAALHHLGEITGEVAHTELLEFIFGSFCIGK